jgi:thioredoxin reductase (NADPH)
MSTINPVITIYGASWCPYCVQAKQFLDEHRVPYSWVDVDAHPKAKEIIRHYNGGMEIIPTIVFPDGSILVAPSNDALAIKLDLQATAPDTNRIRNVVIIGSGPAGYTAALYTARAGLQPLVYTGSQYGGQLMLTTEVENYPGFRDGIIGPTLMAEMRAQAERFGAEMRDREVTSVDFSQRPFKIMADDEIEYAESAIVATGASAKWLGIPGEERYRGYGVSSCATCDGFFFRGRRIVVVGGGDVAIEEAIYLSRLARAVTVIHRRDALRASKAMQQRAFANERIRFIWDTAVEEVVGEINAETGIPRVTSLQTRNLKTGEEELVDTDALFVAIGHEPNTSLFRGHIPLDERGYALTVDAGGTATAIEGVFVAGDVHDHCYRQAVTAAGDGSKAAIDAERWLEAQGIETDYAGVESGGGIMDSVAEKQLTAVKHAS